MSVPLSAGHAVGSWPLFLSAVPPQYVTVTNCSEAHGYWRFPSCTMITSAQPDVHQAATDVLELGTTSDDAVGQLRVNVALECTNPR